MILQLEGLQAAILLLRAELPQLKQICRSRSHSQSKPENSIIIITKPPYCIMNTAAYIRTAINAQPHCISDCASSTYLFVTKEQMSSHDKNLMACEMYIAWIDRCHMSGSHQRKSAISVGRFEVITSYLHECSKRAIGVRPECSRRAYAGEERGDQQLALPHSRRPPRGCCSHIWCGHACQGPRGWLAGVWSPCRAAPAPSFAYSGSKEE